jgi:BlaI family penicillinase repressor
LRNRVTEAELEVLRKLWQRGESGIREVAEELYPAGGPSANATVQKLLDRLGAKGFVDRRAEGRRNLFRALVTRRDLIRLRLQDTADALCEGDLNPLLTQLVESSDLSEEQLDALKQLVGPDDKNDKNEGEAPS